MVMWTQDHGTPITWNIKNGSILKYPLLVEAEMGYPATLGRSYLMGKNQIKYDKLISIIYMESFSVLTFKNISDAISLYRTVEFGKLSEKQIIGQHLNKLNHTLKSMLSL